MSDPLPLDPRTSSPDGHSEGRDARIERLLLSGLDLYFAGQYEQAIDVWTRVAFLERGHDRARAYIERARTALAERHREAEELLHLGIDAFNRGETDVARDLINRAVEQVGPHDLAVVFLDRLNRLDPVPNSAAASQRAVSPRVGASLPGLSSPAAGDRQVWPTAVATLCGLAVVAILATPFWASEGSAPAGAPLLPVADDPLPIAYPSEVLLSRARSLAAGGHLHDALRLLDDIRQTDAFRPDADRLMAEIQRQLLDVAQPPSYGAKPTPAALP